MSSIIQVDKLSKRYRLGLIGASSLREEIATLGQRLLGKASSKPSRKEFWALRDVSFEVESGEVIGIIGHNGAGKSTLLKLLSRITEPTYGEAKLHGRMASLLEVGTGFHPELSGRDNIFLSGAIMGLKRPQIRERFDKIVEFAEIEQFIDTPVKRYSSGMYVRLGFAIAAHLDPEILIIDEVLAVGDQRFQQRCLGKMREVSSEEGRTVIFVSHNLGMVQNLCHRCLYLQKGQLKAEGTPAKIIQQYLNKTKSEMSTALVDRKDRSGSGVVQFSHYRFLDKQGNAVESCVSGQAITIELGYVNKQPSQSSEIEVCFAIKSATDEYLLLYRSNFEGIRFVLDETQGTLQCTIDSLPLAAGTYRCEIFIGDRQERVYDLLPSAFMLEVLDGDFFGTGSQGLPSHCRVLDRAHWEHRRL